MCIRMLSGMKIGEGRRRREEGKGEVCEGREEKRTKDQKRSGGSILCVCWVVSVECIIVYTTHTHTVGKEGRRGLTETPTKKSRPRKGCVPASLCV